MPALPLPPSQHIEKYLIDLNLDGSMGARSDVSSTDSKSLTGGSAGGRMAGEPAVDPSLQFLHSMSPPPPAP